MTSLLRSWKHPLRQQRWCSRKLSKYSASTTITPSLVEEETLPYYQPQQYYPVNIGDVYNSKYRTVGKLGYGAYSTVWLCRVLNESNPHSKDEYVALKLSTAIHGSPDKTRRESKIYQHLSTVMSAHPGQSMIRGLYDTFETESPSGPHQCLIQPAMHMSLLEMTELNDEPFNLLLLKMTIKRLLYALDFLHTDAGIVHTDLKADNIMLTVEDETMLSRFEEAELESASPRKAVDGSRTIYKSRWLPKPKDSRYGLPVLCDFGEARIGRLQRSGPFVQPHIYRAPEVIFEMPWGPAADIWNLACLTWDLFEGEHLFKHIFDSKGHYDPFQHLAKMVGLIGTPPIEFIKRSETTEQCFDVKGKWIADEHAKVPITSLEDRELRLEGRENSLFINFIRSMLQWLPEERKTAKQLLQDDWLQD